MEESTERKTKFRVMIRWSNDEQRMVWHKDIDVLLPKGADIEPFNIEEVIGRYYVGSFTMVVWENLLIIDTVDTLVMDRPKKTPDWFVEGMQAAGWILNAENPYAYDCVV